MRGFGRYGRDYPPDQERGWRAGGYGNDYGGGWGGYDRGYRRGHERPRRRGYDRHLRGYAAGYPPYDATGWMPFAMAPLGFDPMLGWAGWGAGVGWVPPGPVRAYDEPRRVPPRESPTYGRGGDRALRRWAERYGYDFEYIIQPRRGPRY